jgi:predicted permease
VSLPRGVGFLLRAFVPSDRVEDVLGDLEEVHGERVERRGPWLAAIPTILEAAEVSAAAGLMRLRSQTVVPMSWIDFKLGVRMLVKYPGLTLVGGLAMAFGIFVGAACYEFYAQVLHPTLPLDEGERVVALDLLDDRSQYPELRVLRDFSVWRSELAGVQELGAANPRLSTLVVGDDRGEPIESAEMTASAFQVARVPPLMGRTLVEADESPRAPSVAVIGYQVWQTRFGADPEVVGRTVAVDGVDRTIVGVMPPGFGFPVNQQLWTPLRVDPALEPLEGPAVFVFGRLAPGVTIDMARAELDRYVAGAVGETPGAYAHLHARVRPYTDGAWHIRIFGDILPEIVLVNVFAGLFLVLVCGNVALLVFARAAAREGEIVVRAALGASRWRIVSQFFFEALVLGTLAGVVGVSVVGWGLERLVNAVLDGQLPAFWHHTSLSPRTLVYAALLTLLAALIAGAVPGLKITSGDLESRLRRQTSGGGGLRFGGVWTAVIVLQIAATVTFPAVGWSRRQESVHVERQDLGFASTQYLAFRLGFKNVSITSDEDLVQHKARLARAVRALSERLDAEVAVHGVTMTRAVPGTHHATRRVEMDGGGEAPRNEWDEMGVGRRLRGGLVAWNYFEVLGVAPIQGRTFDAADTDPEARTVLVNQPFVDEVLGGRNPIGRELRYLSSDDGWEGVEPGDEPGPWYRIVGVVPELGMGTGANPEIPRAGLYHAVPPGSLGGRTWLLVNVSGDPPAFAARLREIAAAVDPDIALLDLQPLEAVREAQLRAYTYGVWLIVGVSGVALLLSLAGIYSVTAFTVTRRTREIGLRIALGAGPAQVAGATFRRPLMQVAAGLLVGLGLCALLFRGRDAFLWGKPLVVLLSYTAVMTAVCSLACVIPMRRALSVEPTEALAADG